MRCNHRPLGGTRCRRDALNGQAYCWQHLELYAPVQPITPQVDALTPVVLATAIREADLIPISYRRQFAVEICEAFRDINPNFDSRTFMAMIGDKQ